MKCPECGFQAPHEVIESRPKFRGQEYVVRRRRVCKGCSARFTTYEYVDLSTGPSCPALPKDTVLKREINVYLEDLTAAELAQVKALIVVWLEKKKRLSSVVTKINSST